jgi:hypothetical protein
VQDSAFAAIRLAFGDYVPLLQRLRCPCCYWLGDWAAACTEARSLAEHFRFASAFHLIVGTRLIVCNVFIVALHSSPGVPTIALQSNPTTVPPAFARWPSSSKGVIATHAAVAAVAHPSV